MLARSFGYDFETDSWIEPDGEPEHVLRLWAQVYSFSMQPTVFMCKISSKR